MPIEPTFQSFSSLPDFYVWQVSGHAISVHLSLDVVRRLNEEHLRFAPESQCDLRGVLIGHTIYRNHPAVFVEEYELINHDEEPDGPTSSSLVERAFARTASKWSRDGLRRRYAVGFFRSQRAGWLSLNDTDLSIATKSFNDPDNVVLLIRFSEARVSEGAFFIREQGEIRGSQSFREFPFDAAALSARNQVPDAAMSSSSGEFLQADRAMPPPLPREQSQAEPQRPKPPIVVTAEAADQFPVVPAAIFREPIRWNRLLPTAVLATLGVASLRAAWDFNWGPGRHSSPAVQASYQPPLGLKVDLDQRQLSVSWNHNGPVVAAAVNGEITIRDGELKNTIPLDRKQLQDANIVYQPLMNDLDVRLDVTEPDGRGVGESVIVLTNRSEKPVKP